MSEFLFEEGCCCGRRVFLQTVGAAAGGMALGAGGLVAADGPAALPAPKKSPAVVRVVFLYPPSALLRKKGYWSWPGSSFDAEGHQKQYTAKLQEIAKRLDMRVVADEKPICDDAGVAALLSSVKQAKPDALLLVPMYKGFWGLVTKIVQGSQVPNVIFATWAVLFIEHTRQLYRKPGVYLINSPENLEAVEYGLRMVRTARWMREARIVNVAGVGVREGTAPPFGSQIRNVPRARFVEELARVDLAAARKLADSFRTGAKEIVEPTEQDILDAAKGYFALKRILEVEHGDALMLQCLEGLQRPEGKQALHSPACMGFMCLRDEGIVAACQADLESAITMMLFQQLFGKPGFEHNLGVDTERNEYFASHCTSASKMRGVGTPPEPYVLRSHNEAGWGCVPRVLMTPGEDVTIAQYVAGAKTPKMCVYSGKIVRVPPPSGCRTNVVTTINELDDVCLLGSNPMGHMCLCYGNHAKRLRAFCQLYGIQAVS